MGDNLRNVNYADLGSANCNVFLDGCQPSQTVFLPSSMLRHAQKAEGESCWASGGASGYCDVGLYCDRSFTCRRLPWTPPPTNTYPLYLYNHQQGPAKPGPPHSYNIIPSSQPPNHCSK